MAKEEYASFGGEDDFSEGGGLIQGRLKWKDPRFTIFDYNGAGPETPSFAVDLEPEDGETVTQYWSCGSLDEWTPSKDGKRLIKVGRMAKLSKSCKYYRLLTSLWEAKFPKEKMVDDVSILDGMVCDMVRVPDVERKGLEPKKDKKYAADVLVVDSIVTLPWDQEGGESAGDDLASEATSIILEILPDHKMGMAKMKLAGEVFNRLKKTLGTGKDSMTKINSIVQLITAKDEELLKSGPWTYEKGTVSQ